MESPRDRPPRILVVEDSPTQAAQLEAVLTSDGYVVSVAGTAARAIEIFSSEPADLVMLDVVLPDGDGFDVCRKIRDAEGGADVPILLLTGMDDISHVIRGLESGATNFIVKPYDVDHLLRRIGHALANPHPADASAVQEVETRFHGEHYSFRASPSHMVSYLISTFEDMMSSRAELQRAEIAAATAQESRAFVQAALDALSAHVAVLDEDGHIVEVNAAWKQFAELNGFHGPAFGMGENYLETCAAAAERGDRVAAEVEKGLRELLRFERDSFYAEYPCHSPTENRWFELRASRFREARPLRVVVSHEDVTEVKLKQQELVRSRARLEEASRIARLAHWVWEPHSGRLFWSKSHFELFGFEQDSFEPTLDRFLDLVVQEDRDRVNQWLDGLEGYAGPERLEFRATLPGGAVRVFHTEAAVEPRAAHDPPPRVLGTVQDITELVAAQDALRLSEEQYRGLVEHATYGICQVSADGMILQANPAMAEILGCSSVDEVTEGVSLHDLFVSPHDYDRAMERFGSDQAATGIEVEWWRADGGSAHVRLSGRLATGERNGGSYYALIVEDVTEKHVLEQSFQQAQRMEAVGRLAGGIAHDFNNVLTVIMTEAQMALRRNPRDEQTRESFEEILTAGGRAAALTRQLLGFSRKELMQATVFDLGETVTALQSMLARLIEESIEMVVVVPESPLTVYADRGQVEQALTNLAVNARDAMPQGGVLRIELTDATIDEAFVRHNPEAKPGEYACVSVSDTGTGIPEGVREHIFEPFVTTKEVGKGTGLGLAQVYGIVKKSEGYVRVESEVDVGTSFEIYLPRAESDRQREQEAESTVVPAGGNERILLVEDEAQVRRAEVRMLESEGYVVHAAESGTKALALIENADPPYDLLVTDVVLPGMGGREIAERAQAACPGIRVLFQSGYTDDEVLQRQLFDRGARLLEKPFTFESLMRRVREALDDQPNGGAQ